MLTCYHILKVGLVIVLRPARTRCKIDFIRVFGHFCLKCARWRTAQWIFTVYMVTGTQVRPVKNRLCSEIITEINRGEKNGIERGQSIVIQCIEWTKKYRRNCSCPHVCNIYWSRVPGQISLVRHRSTTDTAVDFCFKSPREQDIIAARCLSSEFLIL